MITNKSPNWNSKSTYRNWIASTKRCDPIISKRVSEVSFEDVTEIFRPLWHAHPPSAANTRSHLSAVMRWAINQGYRTTNVADSRLAETFGKLKKATHYSAPPYVECGARLAVIRDSEYWWGDRLCFLFLALTAVRSSEARGATWDEIDFEKRTWTIPAARTKTKERDHSVPLCDLN